MCGIAGIISEDTTLHRVLPRMVETLRHRGPDDEGFAYIGPAALGHRRLSIIDLDHGRQPMLNEDQTIGIIFNGEIYNFPALRRELEAEGYRFRTRSDTEVLLRLYERDGVDCVTRLEGMFAFAIWDDRHRRLLLVRDHMGQKPLFYARVANAILFASEVKGILASGLLPARPDLEAIYHYISLRFIPDRLTLFRGVHKLPAAHRLVIEGGEERIERYWRLARWEKMRGSEEELIDRLDHELSETVKDHLLSDVPVGSFLSGGIDSSLITALMTRHSVGPVSTFSIGVEEHDFNELPYARLVAEQYGTRHHEEVVRPDLVRLVPRMIWHLDEPADPFGIGVYLASKLASRHVKVVLSGDGGDELFAGYDRYAGQRLADIYCVLPAALRRTVMRRIIERVPDSYGYKSFAQKLRWLNEVSLLSRGERYARSMSFLRFTDEDKARLFTPSARAALGRLDSQQKILEHFDTPGIPDLVDRMLYTDLMTRMPDHLLSIVDRMAMAHGLEVRPPFMGHRMVEFAAAIPASLKLKGTRLKYILRRVAARHLHPALVRRKKQGFGFPLAYWLRGELRPLLLEVMRRSRFIEAGIFEPGYVHGLMEEHLEGKRDHNYRLWLLLNLELWHRLFLEGQSVEAVGQWVDEQARGSGRQADALTATAR